MRTEPFDILMSGTFEFIATAIFTGYLVWLRWCLPPDSHPPQCLFCPGHPYSWSPESPPTPAPRSRFLVSQVERESR